MRKDVILMIVGGAVFIMPLLGLPYRIKDPTLFTLGALTFFIALLYRIEVRRRERRAHEVMHTEHNPELVHHNAP